MEEENRSSNRLMNYQKEEAMDPELGFPPSSSFPIDLLPSLFFSDNGKSNAYWSSLPKRPSKPSRGRAHAPAICSPG